MKGEKIVECAYVRSDLTEAAYFATPLRLGVSPLFQILLLMNNPFQPSGIEENLGMGGLSDFEKQKLTEVRPNLSKCLDLFFSRPCQNCWVILKRA